MRSTKPPQSIWRMIAIFGLLAMVALTASRIGLGLWQSDRVAAAEGWTHMLLQGARVDIATLCWLWGIAALGTVIFAGNHAIGRVWLVLLRGWLVLGLWLMLFLELSTPS